MAANLDVVPVVFEAAPTAAVAGSLANFTLRHADPKHPKIYTQFSQMAELVTGGPGQSVYWTSTVEREAIVVAEEVPFSIRIVEPKVPLVQNGSMQLKIVAERKPGFTAADHDLTALQSARRRLGHRGYHPREGQRNADADERGEQRSGAQMEDGGLGCRGHRHGPVWVSSQLATIEIAPPLVAFNMERAPSSRARRRTCSARSSRSRRFRARPRSRLMGLPPKVTTPEVEITKDTKELAFKLTTDKTSPAGIHRNLFCQVVVVSNGEPIVASTGYSELRIDVPIAKKDPPKPPPVVVAAKPAASSARQAAGKAPDAAGEVAAGTGRAREGRQGRFGHAASEVVISFVASGVA